MRNKGIRQSGGRDVKNEAYNTVLYSLVSAFLNSLYDYHKFNLHYVFPRVFLLRTRSLQWGWEKKELTVTSAIGDDRQVSLRATLAWFHNFCTICILYVLTHTYTCMLQAESLEHCDCYDNLINLIQICLFIFTF